jgi:hypothetical protein
MADQSGRARRYTPLLYANARRRRNAPVRDRRAASRIKRGPMRRQEKPRGGLRSTGFWAVDYRSLQSPPPKLLVNDRSSAVKPYAFTNARLEGKRCRPTRHTPGRCVRSATRKITQTTRTSTSINADLPDRCAPGQPKHREYDAQFDSRQTSPSNRVTLCGPIRKSQATSFTLLHFFSTNASRWQTTRRAVGRSGGIPVAFYRAPPARVCWAMYGWISRAIPPRDFSIHPNARGPYLNRRQVVEYHECVRTE